MEKLINIHLAIGGYIMKEKIAVIWTAITKGSWSGMIMAAMRLKNNTKKYSKESLEKLSSCRCKIV